MSVSVLDTDADTTFFRGDPDGATELPIPKQCLTQAIGY